MKSKIECVMRFRHRFGWIGTALLFIPVLLLVLFLLDWYATFCYTLPWRFSQLLQIGQNELASLFRMPDRSNSTEFIFYALWEFTFLAVVSLPLALMVRWMSDREKRSAYRVYAFGGMVLGFILFWMLFYPLSLLLLYVNEMGFTPRRVKGLCYCAGWGVILTGFVVSAFLTKGTIRRQGWKRMFAIGMAAVALLAAAPGVLLVRVVAEPRVVRDYCLHRVNHERLAQASLALIESADSAVTFEPKNENWQQLPAELKLWNLKSVRMYPDEGTLIFSLNDEISYMKFSKRWKKPVVWALEFQGGAGYRDILLTTLKPPPEENTAPTP